jgi:hypothetical protein
MLSLFGGGLYLLVVLACMIAWATALRGRQLPAHWQTWAVIAGLFGLFAMLRFTNFEEIARDSLRGYFKAEGMYGDRRAVQGPIVALVLAIIATVAFVLPYRWSRIVRGRRNVARVTAVLAVLVMLLLIALRLASLHAVDALLYGTWKLNWIIDIGASLTALGAAAYYVKLVRARP